MARPELGNKRICGECGTRFYDLNRDPIICPKCETVFVVAVAPVAPKAKPAAAVKEPAKEPVKDDDEDELDEALVPLEDADAEVVDTGRKDADDDDDDDDDDIPDVDIEIDDDDDDDDDDDFLEDDEESGDDVSVLIDGDIVKDEET